MAWTLRSAVGWLVGRGGSFLGWAPRRRYWILGLAFVSAAALEGGGIFPFSCGHAYTHHSATNSKPQKATLRTTPEPDSLADRFSVPVLAALETKANNFWSLRVVPKAICTLRCHPHSAMTSIGKETSQPFCMDGQPGSWRPESHPHSQVKESRLACLHRRRP